MADYTSLVRQGQSLRDLALQEQAEREQRNQARFAAYLWLAREPNGQVLLDDWCLTLLKPSACPEDEGEKRFIQKILKVIREDAPRALAGST
jgi:hypothetical protein